VRQASLRNPPTSEPSGARRLGLALRLLRECRRGLVGSALACVLHGCGTAAPPADAEYPSLVLPAQAPPQRPSQPAAAHASRTPPPVAAPATGAATAAASGAAPDASAESGTAAPTQGDLPDPVPLSERAQWSYPITYDRGTIRVGEPEPMCLPRPQPTPRRIGRFAFELWLGRELIDRVRFDFPLLATEEPPAGPRRPLRDTPRFAPGARVSVTLRVPASDRAATARIFDRATGDSTEVPWPPRSSADVTRSRPCPTAAPRAGAVMPASSDAVR